MITRLGFGSSLGLYAPGSDDDGRPTISDSAAQSVDEEIKVNAITTTVILTFRAVPDMVCYSY
jgi:hypothetical protein